jgi:glyoxylase-like metal-dependent hydrolase (beta-lactamase superfamily II)
MLNRRTVLAGTAAVAFAHHARAQTTAPGAQIGALRVRVLSDGHMKVGLDRFAAKPTDDAAFKAALGATTQPQFALNTALVETEGRRILIDSGAGGTWVDTAGKLSDTLGAQGVDPASINTVVLTHAHPDHLWGVIDDFDNTLRFPNATYTLPKSEFDFWMSSGVAEAAGAAEGVIAGARRVLKAIEPKLKLAAAEGPVLPGLAYVEAKGHTPGQCAVLVSSGGAHALFAADTLFHPVVSVAYPEWHPAQDMDGERAAKSRRKMLDLAANLQALVIATHIEAPGRITKTGTSFLWAPA